MVHPKKPAQEKQRKDSAGSGDTASMIKGGGYLGARIRQPPTTQTIKRKLVWVRGVVCRSTQARSLAVVACVILQCIPCFYECRCMSVQTLALRFHVLGHSILTRASFHLKTRQKYFLHSKESFGVLTTRFDGTWLFALFGTPFAEFKKGNGPNWGTWPITAPFRPIFVAMIFLL